MKTLYGSIIAVAGAIVLSSEVVMACASCGCAAPKPQKPVANEHAELAEVDTHVLAKLIASGVDLTILDARSGKWDDGRRIPGAVALAPDAKAADASEVIESKDSLLVTYCSNLKCGASAALAKRLGELGYKNILEYPHGIDGWEKHGQKVVKNK